MISRFNDAAARWLSHPLVVLVWWLASSGSLALFAFHPTEIAGTLALSFLALAYSSAIAEKQLRDEAVTRERDCAMHLKLDELVKATPGAADAVAGIEPK